MTAPKTFEQLREWILAVHASSVTATTKSILTVLAMHHSLTTGQCNPGLNRLADETNIDKRQVTRSLKEAIAAGWITIERGNGRYDRNQYVLASGGGTYCPPSDAARGDTVSPLRGDNFAPSRGDKIDVSGGTKSTAYNRKKNRKGKQGESAQERASLSEARDFANLAVKQSEIEIIPPENAASQRTGKPTPLQPDWTPSVEDWAHAANKGLTADGIDAEAERFRDWHALKGTKSRDWAAEWRRWIGNSRENTRNTHNGRRNERIAELIREAKAIDAAKRAAGLDPETIARQAAEEQARQAVEAARQRAEAGPPWDGILRAIKSRLHGRQFSAANQSFRRQAFRDGVLEIAIASPDLYPDSTRDALAACIRVQYPEIAAVAFRCGGTR